jgi:hypothetical protein
MAAGFTSSTEPSESRQRSSPVPGVHGDIVDRAPDYLAWIGWRPLSILRSKATEIAARIANFSVEHIRVVDPCTDYRPAHRAQHVRDFVVGYGHNDQMIADKRLAVLAVRHALR